MPDISASAAPTRRAFTLGPLATVTAAIALVAALAAVAYPAFRADPVSGPGVLLLGGLTALALLGLLQQVRGQAEPVRDTTADLLDGLVEPAALVGPDGRVLMANPAWREAGGPTRRLSRGRFAASLYLAFVEARDGRQGRALGRLGEAEVELLVARAGEDHYLVRAAPEALLSPPLPAMSGPAARVPDAAVARASAAGAPFGSAVVAGFDLFDGEIVECNAALPILTGPRARAGARLSDLVEASGLDEAREKIAAGSAGPIELAVKGAKPARALHLYIAPEGEHRRVWLFDISEQKQLELQLQQAQKMQAIGQLAGGVAHDFNNLLTTIEFWLDDLLARHPVGDPSYEGLNQIRQTGNRAADLVSKLLAFSRKQTVRRERLDVGEVISEFEVLLRRLLREDVRLDTVYGRDLPVVMADKSALETAIMNLAVNARDALKGHVAQGQGQVRIRTEAMSVDQARQSGWRDAPLEAASIAVIEVSDNGPGIPPALLDKIFEPFFTTKAVGEGTGMGLATVYGIVEQARGHIDVANLAEGGAAFRIFLPAAPAAELQAPVAEAAQPRPRAQPRDLSGAGRILFVEDEHSVRDIAARLLRARGYEVLEAGDGEEALVIARENAGRIDMLISDVIMPGLDGPSLLKQARAYLGDAPVMFISGYAEADFSDLLQDQENISFLPKPLNIKTLAERVKQELHAA